MIKARINHPASGKTYMVLGLIDDDIKMLKEGMPIGLVLADYNYAPGEAPDTVVLVHARDNETLSARMRTIRAFPGGIGFADVGTGVMQRGGPENLTVSNLKVKHGETIGDALDKKEKN